MLFGHNTNVRLGDSVFHVQTEDRGAVHALIDTTVYHGGRVLHRRTNNYFDLLPLNDDRREALRLRLEDQHTTVIEEMRSGALQLVVPAGKTANDSGSVSPGRVVPARPSHETATLALELANAKSWLSGRHAKLQLLVRDSHGSPVDRAQIRVEIEGGETVIVPEAQTGASGEAQLEFEMPKITSPNAALVIRAENQSAKGYIRFGLRAKPRVA
jgi:hypothetical protein